MFLQVSGGSVVIVRLSLKAIAVRYLSEASFTSFQRFDLNSNPVQIRFWNSCRPLELKIGQFGAINSHKILLIIFGDVILSNLLTLLLTV